MSSGELRYRLRMLLTAGLLAAVVAAAAYATGVLGALEDSSVDSRYRHREAQQPADMLVIAVDDRTFDELGQQWPFKRSVFGRAARVLHKAGAREIVFDVQFTERTTDAQDFALYDGIGAAGGAVLATASSDGKGHTKVFGGDEHLRPIHSRAASSTFPDDTGGTIRRVPYAMVDLPTIATVVAKRAGRPVPASAFEKGGAWIDFRGPPGTIATVSFSSLVRGKVPASVIRGRTVVIGATDPTIHDQHATSASTELMAGPEVQANAIWTVLHGLPLRSAATWLDLLAILGLAFVVPVLAIRVRPVFAALAAPAAGLAYVALAQIAFEHGTMLTVAAPVLGLALATVATVAVSYMLEIVERQRMAGLNDLLEREVLARTQELRDTELEMIQRLGHAVESRDEETGDHISRIGDLSYRLGLAAGMRQDEAELLQRASAMHDLGKIAIPDEILRKPGPLDAAEREVIERHPLIGAELLAGSRSPLVQLAEVIARTHHERWDGTGYPLGLKGEDIPLAGRITAVCDVYDALVSDRPYKRAWTYAEARDELRAQSGRHFDPRLVELFLSLATDAPDRAPVIMEA
jgi:HD-GYP domain-containing protein (c-di-GMP phosphodiesterase class II)